MLFTYSYTCTCLFMTCTSKYFAHSCIGNSCDNKRSLFAEGQQVCRSTTLGKEYTGTLTVTNAGKTCQPWLSQLPHSHTRNNPASFPDANLVEASNYCRNPDNAPYGPWCYTTDSNSRWDYCDVPYCPPTPGSVKPSANIYLYRGGGWGGGGGGHYAWCVFWELTNIQIGF